MKLRSGKTIDKNSNSQEKDTIISNSPKYSYNNSPYLPTISEKLKKVNTKKEKWEIIYPVLDYYCDFRDDDYDIVPLYLYFNEYINFEEFYLKYTPFKLKPKFGGDGEYFDIEHMEYFAEQCRKCLDDMKLNGNYTENDAPYLQENNYYELRRVYENSYNEIIKDANTKILMPDNSDIKLYNNIKSMTKKEKWEWISYLINQDNYGYSIRMILFLSEFINMPVFLDYYFDYNHEEDLEKNLYNCYARDILYTLGFSEEFKFKGYKFKTIDQILEIYENIYNEVIKDI